jgi:hypothetical protein
VPPVIPVLPPPATIVPPATPAIGTHGDATGSPASLPKPPAPFPATPIKPDASGDDTMRQLNQAAALAIIGGAFLANSTSADASPVFPIPTAAIAAQGGKDEKTDIADLKKQVEDANKKLTAIQADLKTIAEVLNGRKDEKGVTLTSDPGLVAQMKQLSDKLYELENELTKLKSTSLRPPSVAAAPTGKGTVRIVNEYPVRVSIVVNGTSYRVEPTKSLDVEVAAGEFTYQLLESGAASTKSTIKEKETVTLRIK